MVNAQRLRGSLLSLLFSPSGAIGRACFVGGSVMLGALALACDRLARVHADPIGLAPFLFALAILWVAGCLCRKRLHDLGRSGWLILVFLTAYIIFVLAAPFIFDMTADGSWRHARLMTILFAAPTVAWIAWLAAVPGELARRAARLSGPDLAPPTETGMVHVLRAGRM